MSAGKLVGKWQDVASIDVTNEEMFFILYALTFFCSMQARQGIRPSAIFLIVGQRLIDRMVDTLSENELSPEVRRMFKAFLDFENLED
jgi:hypothetical protein